MKWPARRLDLTTCNNSLWGYMKDIVSKQPYNINEEMKVAVTAPFGTITPAMLRKMSLRTSCPMLCSENEGQHTCTGYIRYMDRFDV
ncbi:uncharacterized protein LOC143229676 isoform X2 [Tachypleus tridentatus]|uniref:uncharacterized protein LOC143229676 isoform X2 n=1 Tax=Tachypleus tridentatus TaxID=6853 RepID=UPI003FD5ADB5